jgi:hypothetical protein
MGPLPMQGSPFGGRALSCRQMCKKPRPGYLAPGTRHPVPDPPWGMHQFKSEQSPTHLDNTNSPKQIVGRCRGKRGD